METEFTGSLAPFFDAAANNGYSAYDAIRYARLRSTKSGRRVDFRTGARNLLRIVFPQTQKPSMELTAEEQALYDQAKRVGLSDREARAYALKGPGIKDTTSPHSDGYRAASSVGMVAEARSRRFHYKKTLQ